MKNKSSLKRLLTAVAALLLLATLFGCGTPAGNDPSDPSADVPGEEENKPEDPGETEDPATPTNVLKINGTDVSEYVIGFNKKAVSGGEAAVTYFNGKLEEICGKTLKTSTAIKDRFEIHIAQDTGNAEISAAYGTSDGAMIGVSGKKIFLLGLNYASLCGVIDAFFAKATGNEAEKNITVEKNENVTLPKCSLTFLSYNVQQDLKKAGRASTAMQDMIDIISAESPDVWGAQECTAAIGKAFVKNLPAYSMYEGNVYDESSRVGDYVFWKTEKFNLIDKGHWFMSDTPTTKSKYDGSNTWRGFTYVKLEEKTSGKQFLFVNVHTDYRSDENTRLKQLKVLSAFLERVGKKIPVVVLGDFNTTAKGDSIVTFLEDNPTMAMTSEIAETKGDVGSTLAIAEFSKRDIYTFDYIFVTYEQIYTKYYTAVATMANGKYPSDHLPVLVKTDIY